MPWLGVLLETCCKTLQRNEFDCLKCLRTTCLGKLLLKYSVYMKIQYKGMNAAAASVIALVCVFISAGPEDETSAFRTYRHKLYVNLTSHRAKGSSKVCWFQCCSKRIPTGLVHPLPTNHQICNPTGLWHKAQCEEMFGLAQSGGGCLSAVLCLHGKEKHVLEESCESISGNKSGSGCRLGIGAGITHSTLWVLAAACVL